jgi:beta-galactosidase
MEDIGQAYGYILYRTNLKISPGSNLVFDALHDYAAIYYGRQPRGTLDRRLGKSTLTLPSSGYNAQNVELNLFVEESSRINYSKQLRTDRKGITHSVALVHPAAQPEISPSEKPGRVSESTSIARRESVAPALDRLTPIANWLIYPIPMQHPESLPFTSAPCTGPCFYRGAFTIDHPADTFLDTSQLTKGQLWVNGHALGRFWNIGPQKTLYLPGPWLKPGVNQIVVFDLDSAPSRSIAGLAKPNLGN